MLDEPTLNVKNERTDYETGFVIGERFVLQNALGQGTYGSVFRAIDKSLEKEVAVKILHHHLLQDAAAVNRFLKEAQSSCRLQQENIISTYAIGQTEQHAPFIVMELVEGITLKDWLLINKPSFDQILIILRGIAAGLSAAHAQRIVHRDLKPSNVMVVESKGIPHPKVLDFGLAKVLSVPHEQRLTQTGAMLGTPAYMSPELCMGKEVDERSDLYSLGCVLYEMCTGDPPFKGSSALDTMGKHLREDPLPLPAGMPTAFQSLIEKLMAKDPGERIQSVAELIQDIDAVQASSLKLKQAATIRAKNRIVSSCLLIAAALIIPYTVAMTVPHWVDWLHPSLRAPVLDGLWAAGTRDEHFRNSCQLIADHLKNTKHYEQEVKWRQRVEALPSASYEEMVLAKYRLGCALSQAGFLGGEVSTYCTPAIKYYSARSLARTSAGLPAAYKQIQKLLPFPSQLDLRTGPIDAYWPSKEIGCICYEVGDFANADKILEMVVKEEKRHDTVAWELVTELQAYRSRAKQGLNDRPGAIRLAKEASMAIEKMATPPVTTYGNNYRLLGQIWQPLDEQIAEQMYLKSIALDKKLKGVATFQYVTWQNLGQLYMKQNRKAEAATALTNAKNLINGRPAVGPL